MKEIREGNIFIYKLCICIKSRTHYTPKKKKNSHIDTHAQEWAYIETQDTRQQWWTISCEVWRESRSRRKASTRVVRSACLADVSDRCGKKKKKTVFRRRASAVRRCGTVYKKRRVSRRCAVCYPKRGRRRKNKKRQVIQEGRAKVCPVFMCAQRILERESGVALFQGEKANVRYA